MAQNIYDDAAFFAGYSQFPRSREGLAAAGEWPTLRGMLPDLTGRHVLDLGCGLGYHCQWALSAGAAAVTGLDLSENMLAAARARCAGLPIRFERVDLETADFGTARYDVTFSSLAVHYLADFDSFCARVRQALKAEGCFIFSMEHPVYAARANPETVPDAKGYPVAAVEDYLREGERVTDWIAQGVVKHHRLISTTIMTLMRHGLRLSAINEWAPSDADIAAHPDWRARRYDPMFLLFAAQVDSSLPAQS